MPLDIAYVLSGEERMNEQTGELGNKIIKLVELGYSISFSSHTLTNGIKVSITNTGRTHNFIISPKILQLYRMGATEYINSLVHTAIQDITSFNEKETS